MNTKFEAHKIEVQIKRSGTDITIMRKFKNEFGEPEQDYRPVIHIRGLFYNSSDAGTFNLITTSDTGSSRSKSNSGFLCLASELCTVSLEPYDIAIIHGREYLIQMLTDIGDWGKVYDISVEAVDHGTKARLE